MEAETVILGSRQREKSIIVSHGVQRGRMRVILAYYLGLSKLRDCSVIMTQTSNRFLGFKLIEILLLFKMRKIDHLPKYACPNRVLSHHVPAQQLLTSRTYWYFNKRRLVPIDQVIPIRLPIYKIGIAALLSFQPAFVDYSFLLTPSAHAWWNPGVHLL